MCPTLQALTAFNAVAAIGRIPDDILRDISRLLTYSSTFATRKMKIYRRSWISVTHVCSYWRRLALGSPELWTSIYVTTHTSPFLLHASIRRAKQLAIHIKYQGSGFRLLSIPALQNARILADLISTRNRHVTDFSAVALSEKESIIFLGYLKQRPWELRSSTLGQLDAQRLSLRHIISPSSLRFRESGYYLNLSSRALSHLCIHGIILSSLDDLLITLSRFPALETLDLEFNIIPHEPPLGVTADLAQLKILKIASYRHDSAIQLVTCLSFPVTAAITLCFLIPTQAEPIDFEQSEYLQELAVGIQSITLELEGRQSECRSLTLASTHPPLKLQWKWPWAQSRRNQSFWHTGACAITLPNLTAVTILLGEMFLNEEQWLDILDPLDTVTELQIRLGRISLLSLLSALDELDFCPHLEHIVITYDGEFDSVIHNSLWTCLSQRHREGLPLRAINFFPITQPMMKFARPPCPAIFNWSLDA